MKYPAIKKGESVARINTDLNASVVKDGVYEVALDFEETDNPTKSLYIWDERGSRHCGNIENFIKVTDTKIDVSYIKSSMTNLTKKFRLLTKSEPEKTFIEKGVMDDQENLTSEGRALFEAYLVSKFGAEFKKDVVDKLDEDQK